MKEKIYGIKLSERPVKLMLRIRACASLVEETFPGPSDDTSSRWIDFDGDKSRADVFSFLLSLSHYFLLHQLSF